LQPDWLDPPLDRRLLATLVLRVAKFGAVNGGGGGAGRTCRPVEASSPATTGLRAPVLVLMAVVVVVVLCLRLGPPLCSSAC
jgi:hypothetical protein